ncbi:hypothetical protein LCGC14_0253910 [marine sediment metagenome]|uniref:Demethylmenaquinone methyltransferase n=1 Tax=marine sediment metagenome TaxID=412755 RepID=A0A0F9U3P9_9ZZZZ|nr:ubiquinone/menaquinone biosynthesis methyltransferase [Phycisphaerae bacterium]HDZ45309.1 ubiquinone/menaquinone biosynthesis methyltransferase [Phycisphaerae bacterium]
MTGPAQRDSLLSANDNRRMFDRIARRYDLMNHLLSLGLDRRWRKKAVAMLAPREGGRYLDIGCGTGDVAMEVLRQGPGSHVIGIDPAAEMLAIAERKAERAEAGEGVTFQAGDATELALADGTFDGVISAFCVRNITHRARAFEQMRRVLVPGGMAVILELTVPGSRFVRFGHGLFLRCFVPLAGRLIAGGGTAYRYLADSISDFTEPAEIGRMMDDAGFIETRQIALQGGVVTIFVGRSP